MLRKLAMTCAAFALTLTTLFADEGKVVRIEPDTQQIVLKIEDVEHTVKASEVELLDAEGNPTTLDQFRSGARVDVRMDGEKIQAIQLVK